jgi:D-alanyl-D-alanine carboxypeptidase
MLKRFVTIGILLIVAIAVIFFVITERIPYQLESFAKNYNLSAKDQVFCLENATGTIAEYNQDKLIIPASISKLYTFDFALAKLGKDFRYTTDLFLNENTLYINGGGDPHFVIENLITIMERRTLHYI